MLVFCYVFVPVVARAETETLDVSAIVVTSEENGEEGGNSYGSYGYENSPTTVVFSGQAYPLAKVTVLKNGYLATTAVASTNGTFTVNLTNLSPGNNFFTLYADDVQGRRSTYFSVMLFLTQGFTTTVSGIFIAPTISLGASSVVKGQPLAVAGSSMPVGTVALSIISRADASVVTKYALSMPDGTYIYDLDTESLPLGVYEIKAKSIWGAEISGFGPSLVFTVVSSLPVVPEEIVCAQKGDLNSDCKVNMTDFSILQYWRGKSNVPARADLNADGVITMSDFSILAYNWTG